MLLLFASKALIAPVLLALAAIVEHRWGGVVGGWLLGLPLTSGPMSFFLLTEHGPHYAENAARGALLGLVGAGVFCAGYFLAAQERPWWRSLALAGIACLGVTFALSYVHLALGATLAFVTVVLGTVAVVAAAPKRAPATPTTPAATAPTTARRSLIIRMVTASVVVVGISAASTVLGSVASGMLAAAPAITAVMAVSTHRAAGKDSVRGLLRGSVAGMWGGAAFFAVVGLLVTITAPGVTYAAAIAAAVLVSTIVGRAASSKRLSTVLSSVRAA